MHFGGVWKDRKDFPRHKWARRSLPGAQRHRGWSDLLGARVLVPGWRERRLVAQDGMKLGIPG